MFRRQRLKREAAHLRGRIESNRTRASERAISLRAQALAIIGAPPAVPLAFAFGVLSDRLRIPGMVIVHRITRMLFTVLRLGRLATLLARPTTPVAYRKSGQGT